MSLAISDPREIVAEMLTLTLGSQDQGRPVRDWGELYALSVQQRCAALMWLRSADTIRQHAPPAVVAAWRSMALSVDAEGHSLLSELGATQARLADAGVQSVVLKGPPLSIALYGTPIVRPTHDLDLYVPALQRDSARTALTAHDWRQVEYDRQSQYEVFAKDAGVSRVFLDLFSSVPKHLARADAPPPANIERECDGVAVRMHWGIGLATYLSVHLAKHEFAPLLWYVDFATLWSALTQTEREAELRYATVQEMDRYLDWAVARAEVLPNAARGDADALRLLGITESGRVQPRRWWREITLAATLRGKLQAAVRWILPPDSRSAAGFVRTLLRRLRHLARYGVERVPVSRVGSADRVTSRGAADDAR